MQVDFAQSTRWQSLYRASRYLETANAQALENRWHALIGNLWHASGDGCPKPKDDTTTVEIFELLTHVSEELVIRGECTRVPTSLSDLIQEASRKYTLVDALRGRRLPTGPYFVRFSKLAYILDAVNFGRFKISPASVYRDASLNSAQQDNELDHCVVENWSSPKVKLFGKLAAEEVAPEPQQTHELPVAPIVKLHGRRTDDYYVLCLSSRYDARMFRDFAADAALIIVEPETFLRRVAHRMKKLHPSFEFKHGPTVSYDRFRSQYDLLVPNFSKDFRYRYQNEYRLVWRPPRIAELEREFLEIGSMQDIAFAVSLDAN